MIDCVIACNMGDFLYALPALKTRSIRLFAVPPYLAPLAIVLRPFIQFERLVLLPDEKLTAAGAKGMSWRNQPPSWFAQFGLEDPTIFVMKGGGNHLLDRMSQCAGLTYSLPVDPPLRYLSYKSERPKNPVLLQAETHAAYRLIPWFPETDWPEGSVHIFTGQVHCNVALPCINIHHMDGRPTIEGLWSVIQAIRDSKLVVSVASFTGALASAMGVPTITCHAGTRPEQCGGWVFGGYDATSKDQMLRFMAQVLG